MILFSRGMALRASLERSTGSRLVGELVTLEGLKSAAHLNGQQGRVQSVVDPSSGRHLVKLVRSGMILAWCCTCVVC
jgi:hypothetical protein